MRRPLVTLDRVNVRLGGATVLDAVSLEVHAGDGVAIVGANGSGKSTLLRLLRGEVWPHPASRGRRLFHGQDGAHESPIGVRERFALVAPEAQDAYVRRDWDLRVEVVIRSGFHDALYPAEAATPTQRERVREVATELGVERLLDRSVLTLSRGEGRRVLLARALVARPELLLLDEACDGLDAEAREGFLALVSRVLRGGTAVVMATHRTEEIVPGISRVVAIEGGRIAGATSTPPASATEPPRPGAPLSPALAPRFAGGEGDISCPPAAHQPPRPRASGGEGQGEGQAARQAPLFIVDRVTVLVDSRPVLHDLSFTLHPRERVAVVGANGAGKSTFLRLLAGEEQPAAGTIERLELGCRASTDDLRGRVGVVSPELQARHRLDATGDAVVLSGFAGTVGLAELPTPAQRRAAAETTRRLGIAHLAERHLLSLSYGELRKLLLARALAPRPEVLLLDEPLAGLDPASRAWTLDAVAHACDLGAALVVVTHHADEIPGGVGRLLRLAGGRLG